MTFCPPHNYMLIGVDLYLKIPKRQTNEGAEKSFKMLKVNDAFSV